MKTIKYAYLPKPTKKESNLVNEAIRFPKVMLVLDDGTSGGIVDIKTALSIAMDRDLDLVCVAPQAVPPVCKVINYSKYRYEEEKKEKEATKNQKVVEVKTIQLSPVIASNDFNTKLNQGRKFLEGGDKVRVSLFIKRRYSSLSDKGMEIVNDYIDKCSDIAIVEKKAVFDGKTIQVTITPKKTK